MSPLLWKRHGSGARHLFAAKREPGTEPAQGGLRTSRSDLLSAVAVSVPALTVVPAPVPASHQPGGAGKLWCGRPARRELMRGFPDPRPSGPPPAVQRRPIDVVASGAIEGLRPCRWTAGGLLRCLESPSGAFPPRGSPAPPLCAACRVAWGSTRRNGVPGTPMIARCSRIRGGLGSIPGAAAVRVQRARTTAIGECENL